MLKHYLTVAFRNMRKYRNQTLISIAGLAVGFTCFALSALWIRYEATYDSFHKNAGRIYCVYKSDIFTPSGITRSTNYPLAGYLKETFPEVEDAAPITPSYIERKAKIDGVEHPAYYIHVDSSFLRMFDVKILEGSREFLIPGSRKVAITQEKARQLFGNENPVGKSIVLSDSSTICAVVKGLSKRSNYRFDFLEPFYSQSMDANNNWNISSGEHTLLLLSRETDVETFNKKLYEHKIEKGGIRFTELTIEPLTKIRYKDVELQNQIQVKFQHVFLFALTGLLLILCTLFNYLSLFVNRFRMRQKEFTLRTVCGASVKSLFALLTVEFTLSLLIAIALEMILVKIVYTPFLALSEIQLSLSAIYPETILFVGMVVLVLLATFLAVLILLRRQTLNTVLRKNSKNRFRSLSLIFQLIISVGFAFCTLVILKQVYYLHNTDDLGFAFKDRGGVFVNSGFVYRDGKWEPQKSLEPGVLENQIRQIPEVTEIVSGFQPLLPLYSRSSSRISEWDDKPGDKEPVNMEEVKISKQYIDFYELQLIKGEIPDENSENQVLINESAAKLFGWDNPVGKSFGFSYSGGKNIVVKGVIKNIYNLSPTVPANPCFYKIKPTDNTFYHSEGSLILFKHKAGTWKNLKTKMEEILKKTYPDTLSIMITGSEEAYDKLFQSENALLKLLSLLASVCVLICIFGFVSMVSLTCEERRKEIAIRKINGATIRNILGIFFREYFLILLIGSAIAFSGGYYAMRLWLEQYVLQTSIPFWIYLSIVFVMALVIVLCVGWRVWKASVENPAEVVKSE